MGGHGVDRRRTYGAFDFEGNLLSGRGAPGFEKSGGRRDIRDVYHGNDVFRGQSEECRYPSRNRILVGGFAAPRGKEVYTSWFLVYVGIVAAAATGPAFGMQRLGRWLVVYGLASTAFLMVLMAVRYRRIPAEKQMQPLGAICAAPFSLCLVGLNQSVPVKNAAVLLTVFCLASVFYVLGLAQVLRFIGGRFYPSFSGFTFPFINTAIGTALTRNTLGKAGVSGTLLSLLSSLAEAEIIIAGILLTIVFLRYAMFLFGAEHMKFDLKEKEEEPDNYDRAHSHSPQSDRL